MNLIDLPPIFPSFEKMTAAWDPRLVIGLVDIANDMPGSYPTSNAPWPLPSAIATGRVYCETCQCRLTSKGRIVPSIGVCAALVKFLGYTCWSNLWKTIS